MVSSCAAWSAQTKNADVHNIRKLRLEELVESQHTVPVILFRVLCLKVEIWEA